MNEWSIAGIRSTVKLGTPLSEPRAMVLLEKMCPDLPENFHQTGAGSRRGVYPRGWAETPSPKPGHDQLPYVLAACKNRLSLTCLPATC